MNKKRTVILQGQNPGTHLARTLCRSVPSGTMPFCHGISPTVSQAVCTSRGELVRARVREQLAAIYRTRRG